MLHEDSKLTEKIGEAARNERNGLLIIIMGVFLALAGLIFAAVGDNNIAFLGGTFLSGLGIFSTLLGFYVTAHYAHQYNELLKKL